MDFSLAAQVGVVLASEEGGGSVVSPYVIGGFGLIAMAIFLIILVVGFIYCIFTMYPISTSRTEQHCTKIDSTEP